MRRALLVILIAATLIARAIAQQQPALQPAAKLEAAVESPAPATEQWLSGDIDFGYRWLTGLRGNFPEYRSVVNLGEGPKLFGVDFSIQEPKKRLFDRIEARAYGWGGDPYNTAHIDARKSGAYHFIFDYRNIAYFNAVPSFANPLAPGGFDEQSFDIHRRAASFRLDLFPGKRIVPYVAFDRGSGSGHGIHTWVQQANNEFAVPVLLRDSTNNYRGGLRFELNRFHATIEQGGTTFRNDDQSYFTGANPGDRTTPVLGQTLVLNGLAQAYGVRGSSIYSKALITAHPFARMDVYGQFLFSQPRTDVNYTDLAAGNFAMLSSLLFYSAQQTLGTGAANQPHTTGNAGFEVRPWRRVRVVESWTTDRFHDAASSLVMQRLGSAQTSITALNYGQFVNYNQQQTDVFLEATSSITVRGGYRRVWGNSTVLAGEISQTGNLESGKLHRNIGLAGLTFRPSQKLSLNLDYEAASSDRIYFRTSLNDYHKARGRARYWLAGSLLLQANFQVLNNQNPAAEIRYDFQSRSNSVAVYWTPKGGKRISLMAEYDRSSLRSDIGYLALFLAPAVSSDRDNAHTASSTIDLAAGRAKLTLGGSLFVSSGSRPSRYYQPLARVSWPLERHVHWNAEWRWYGFGEQFYGYEGCRTHVFMTGLRVTR